LQSSISLKSCGIAIAEVFPSSCGIVIADPKKKVARAHLWRPHSHHSHTTNSRKIFEQREFSSKFCLYCKSRKPCVNYAPQSESPFSPKSKRRIFETTLVDSGASNLQRYVLIHTGYFPVEN
jgi:hypothetical protein